MLRYMMMFAFFIALIIGSPRFAQAYSSISCGIPPIPPLGCSRDGAQCTCDQNGHCEWVFTDCR